ncbi:MAG: hypothetical protein GY705_15330 [Bacteroidetes bacterium]|nr:hypothetical protein [Bacteroidota bacterium]
MKQRIFISLSVVAFLFFLNADLQAQSKGKKKKETVEFKDKLWYGGGFNLGFSGYNGANVFSIGVSPMVGYKIFEPFSVGPRFAVNYSYIKYNYGGGRVDVYQPVSYAFGLFARYKIYGPIFAHAEIEFENEALLDLGSQDIIRQNRTNPYIGLGYFSRGRGAFGYEIYLLYNLDEPASSTNLPFEFRLGFTYNF